MGPVCIIREHLWSVFGEEAMFHLRVGRWCCLFSEGRRRMDDKVLDESRSFFRVHTGYFSNIPKCIKAEFIASWECSQSSVVSSSKR
ncbi:hypothetical protein TNCV_5041021 [Trichonephila clavipes]|nr:hypothetical protein TNCV_5041021 [Trichonephila clavipes]